MTGSARNSLREALQERGWSYTRLAAELRRHAAGSQLPKTESLVTLISRWVNNHQQPDDFYRDLLAKALGRSRADLFGDEGAHLEPWAMVGPAELPHDVAGFIGRSGEIDELCRRLLGTGQGADGAVVTIDGLSPSPPATTRRWPSWERRWCCGAGPSRPARPGRAGPATRWPACVAAAAVSGWPARCWSWPRSCAVAVPSRSSLRTTRRVDAYQRVAQSRRTRVVVGGRTFRLVSWWI
jgi:hypothetical protein